MSHTNWGTGPPRGRQKRGSNWCDGWGVRVVEVMKWLSLYQSVTHSISTVVPECRLPLRPARPPQLGLWEIFTAPPSFAPSLAFISTLQAVPFQSIISSPPTPALGGRGEKGSMLRGVEFGLSLLAPVAIRHEALCPFRQPFLSVPSPAWW